MLQSVNLRYQSLYLAITAAGILIAAVAGGLMHPIALFVYPPLGLAIAIVWTHNDIRPERSSWVFKFNLSQRLRKLFGWSSTYKGKV